MYTQHDESLHIHYINSCINILSSVMWHGSTIPVGTPGWKAGVPRHHRTLPRSWLLRAQTTVVLMCLSRSLLYTEKDPGRKCSYKAWTKNKNSDYVSSETIDCAFKFIDSFVNSLLTISAPWQTQSISILISLILNPLPNYLPVCQTYRDILPLNCQGVCYHFPFPVC